MYGETTEEETNNRLRQGAAQQGEISSRSGERYNKTSENWRNKAREEIKFSTSAAVAALKDDERVYNRMLGKVFSGVSVETRRGIVGTPRASLKTKYSSIFLKSIK